MGNKCKVVHDVPKEVQDQVSAIVDGVINVAKAQTTQKFDDILSQDTIEDLFESHVCKAMCPKSEEAYEKYRAQGYSGPMAARKAVVEEIESLRDKGVLPNDVTTASVIYDLLHGTISSAKGKSYSKNLDKVRFRFSRKAGEQPPSYTLATTGDEKFVGRIEQFAGLRDLSRNAFCIMVVREWMDEHMHELEKIKEVRNEEKKRVSDKNRRLLDRLS
jgi:hypothetical protein